MERNELLDRLAADERIPLDTDQLAALLADRLSFTGAAAAHCREQVRLAAGEHIEALRLKALEHGPRVTPVS